VRPVYQLIVKRARFKPISDFHVLWDLVFIAAMLAVGLSDMYKWPMFPDYGAPFFGYTHFEYFSDMLVFFFTLVPIMIVSLFFTMLRILMVKRYIGPVCRGGHQNANRDDWKDLQQESFKLFKQIALLWAWSLIAFKRERIILYTTLAYVSLVILIEDMNSLIMRIREKWMAPIVANVMDVDEIRPADEEKKGG